MINGSLYLIGPTLGPPVNATTGKVIPNQPIVDYQDVIVYVKDPTVDPSLWKYEIHDFPNSASKHQNLILFCVSEESELN